MGRKAYRDPWPEVTVTRKMPYRGRQGGDSTPGPANGADGAQPPAYPVCGAPSPGGGLRCQRLPTVLHQPTDAGGHIWAYRENL